MYDNIHGKNYTKKLPNSLYHETSDQHRKVTAVKVRAHCAKESIKVHHSLTYIQTHTIHTQQNFILLAQTILDQQQLKTQRQ